MKICLLALSIVVTLLTTPYANADEEVHSKTTYTQMADKAGYPIRVHVPYVVEVARVGVEGIDFKDATGTTYCGKVEIKKKISAQIESLNPGDRVVLCLYTVSKSGVGKLLLFHKVSSTTPLDEVHLE